MIAPSSIVSSTEAIGVAICMNWLGVRRFSNRMRMQSLSHFHRRRRIAMHAASMSSPISSTETSPDLHRLRTFVPD